MPDLGAIAMALTSLKTGSEITQTILRTAKAGVVYDAVIKQRSEIIAAQDHVLDAKAAYSTILDEVHELKKRIREFEDFETQKENYRLKQLFPRTFVYERKPIVDDPEATMEVCPNCYANRRISILKGEVRRPYLSEHLACHACGFDICLRMVGDHRDIAAMSRVEQGLDPVVPPGGATRFKISRDLA